MDALPARELDLGVVPFIEEIMALRLSQQINPIYNLSVIRRHAFQQPVEIAQVALDRRSLIQRSGIQGSAHNPLTCLLKRKR